MRIVILTVLTAGVAILAISAKAEDVKPIIVDEIDGEASWYGPGFHGNLTANGETFNQNAMTAAHKTLPFGTTVRVINEANGEITAVRINDRGPFVEGRDIDLSKAAARDIGLVKRGTGDVTLEVLEDWD